MNKSRRNTLAALQEGLLSIRERIEVLKDQERAAFDALPESLQESERGQSLDGNADILDNIVSALDDIDELINEIP